MSDFQEFARADGFAQGYEVRSVPYLFAPLADDLLTLLPPGNAFVVDLCCGTGAVTRRLGRGVGLDLSIEMLSVAAASVPGRVGQADATVLPVRSDVADAVVCQQGFQFVPAPERFLSEARRVLRPGGRLVVSTWAALEDNPLNGAGRAAALAAGWEVPTVPPNAFGFGADRLRSLAEAAGFSVVSCGRREPLTRFGSVDDVVEFAAAPPQVRSRWKEATDAERSAFATSIHGSMAPYVLADGSVEVPLRTDVLVASRPPTGT